MSTKMCILVVELRSTKKQHNERIKGHYYYRSMC